MWRCLDYPTLTPPATKRTDSIPVRYTFPVTEQTLNKVGYDSGVALLGATDIVTTKLFFDTK